MPKKIFCYFDHAAATPLDPRVERAMRPFFARHFGNPSSLHFLGRNVHRAVETARQKIATALNCAPKEFIFISGATEANNLAILGAIRGFIQATPFNRATDAQNHPNIIVSELEHPSVSAAAESLRKAGFETRRVKTFKNGLIDLAHFQKLLNQQTLLVSIIMADSETGTIQPIAEIAKILRAFRNGSTSLTVNSSTNLPFLTPNLPLLHTDATQAANYLGLNVAKLGIDMLTLSGHKIYGPKGVGGLYIKEGLKIEPLIFGGGQQDGRRAGTENVAGIVGFAEALVVAQKNRITETQHVKKMRDELAKQIFHRIPKVVLNGHPKNRLPNFLNVSILDIEGEAATLMLEKYGILVSTGSACHSQSLEPSPNLVALGRPYEHIHGSLRFSLGRLNKPDQIKYAVKKLVEVVKKLRRISPLNLTLTPADSKTPAEPRAFLGGQTPHFLK